jgi:hypothetical protein
MKKQEKSAGKKSVTEKQIVEPVLDIPITETLEIDELPDTAVSDKNEWEFKDRVYILKNGRTPPVEKISSLHTIHKPLLYFDPEKGYSRELKYATNQKSPFVDEQKGVSTLGHIMFRDGVLPVRKEKQNLQKLLSLYHPSLGVIYEELNNEKDAADDLDYYDLAFEAERTARELEIDELEAILRVEEGNKVSTLSSKELKRDGILFAERNPRLFLQLANDENTILRNFGIKAVEAGFIGLSSDQRYFIWKRTGNTLFTIPFDENPYSALAAWFKTDDGVEVYNNLKKKL